MNLRNGLIVKSNLNQKIRVDDSIGVGGQGQAYRVTNLNSGEQGVLKMIASHFDKGHTLTRIRFLTKQQLGRACAVLKAPVDVIEYEGQVGHYAPLASGQPLEKFLENPHATFLEQLQLAISLTQGVEVLHSRQIAHGDLHADNVFVNKVGSVFELSLIDFDNFHAPSLPAPPCIGHNLYMAPELRSAIATGVHVTPNLNTDLYSLGVLLHEILLFLHPASGADADEAQFQRAMGSGHWLHDPATTGRPVGLGGYPPEVLNAELARLFRRSASLLQSERPTAQEWKSELLKAIHQVYLCPHCGCPCVIDSSKISCPMCHRHFPTLQLITTEGKTILLQNGALVLGRDQLGGKPTVSAKHAILRRVGPETWLESLGRHGTFRWASHQWLRLPEGKPILIQRGDRLKFADVEVQVI